MLYYIYKVNNDFSLSITYYLPLSGNNSQMKNIFSTFGFVILITAFVFKIQHWPGATIGLLAGTILSAISFALPKKIKKKTNSLEVLDDEGLPSINQESRGKAIAENIRTTGITIIVISLIIKYIHFPFGNHLFLIGAGIAIIGALLRLKNP